MSNLIINAFAFKENYKTSMQLAGKMDEKKLALYMENIFVSLRSAAIHNPEDTVMLVVNKAVPEPYKSLFERENIKIKEIDFDSYVMPENFVWSLAFFKLCALFHVTEEEDYENFLLLDADTITMQGYREMWEECETGVILYPLGHSYHHHDRERIRSDYVKLYEEQINIVHYGGEYVCGNRQVLRYFLRECRSVYERMKEKDFCVDDHTGDETILSIAAARMQVSRERAAEQGETAFRECAAERGGTVSQDAAQEDGKECHTPEVIAAIPYIYRYWTNDFYLVSMNAVYNPVCIWHLPDEKEHAMEYFYRYYQKKKQFPDRKKSARIAGIRLVKRPFNRYTLQYKLVGKIQKIFTGKR